MREHGAAKTDVVTLGESMILFQSADDKSIAYAGQFAKSVAGAESNVAMGLTRLGRSVRWISRVGKDPFGEVILQTLRGEGVDVACAVQDAEAPTAVYFKEMTWSGDPNVYYYRKGSAASRLSPADIRDEWFADAGHFHVTGITPALGEHTAEAVIQAMKLARSKGLTVSFDPNLRRKLWTEETARTTLLSMLEHCDIFMPGLEEAEFLLGPGTEEEYGRRFLERGPSIVVIKLGAQGSIAFTADAVVEAEGHKVDQVVDTVGAGDAFAAGFLSVMVDALRLDPPQQTEQLHTALKRANVMGAIATQFRGDWEGLPKLEELELILSGTQQVTR